jgi:hypothetical protein
MAYYASGYYAAAKRQRLKHIRHAEPVLAGTPPKAVVTNAADSNALQVSK